MLHKAPLQTHSIMTFIFVFKIIALITAVDPGYEIPDNNDEWDIPGFSTIDKKTKKCNLEIEQSDIDQNETW
jgi:hypothetical protein